jgi:arylsulfatase A-like enzyme
VVRTKRTLLVTGFLILILLSCVFAYLFVVPKKETFLSARAKQALSRELAAIPVLRPENVFADNKFFFAGGRFVIDLKSANGIFRWRIKQHFKGDFVFRMYVFVPGTEKGEDKPKNTIVSEAKVVVKQISKNREITLLTQTITDMDFRNRYAYGKRFQKNIAVERGDLIEFRIKTSHQEIGNNEVLYGITVPKLVSTSLLNRLTYKNLLILSIDTLRPDYLGIYRELAGEDVDFSFSPQIDALSEQGTVFLNAYTPESATWPALASLFVSQYPFEHGVMYNGEFLPSNFDSIATHMLNLGYQTMSLHGNGYRLNIAGIEEKHNFFNDDFSLIDYALKKLRQHKSRPFFHWYHFMGVHSDYRPPLWVMHILSQQEGWTDEDLVKRYSLFQIMQGKEEFNKKILKHIKTSYAGELYHLDFELKRIFDFLKRNNLWDDALIVVTADHGEDLYEHNNYFFHYPSIYETSIRIPLIIKFPGQHKRIVVKEQTSIMDIFPTIYEYYAKDGPSAQEPQFSGISLLGLLNGEKAKFHHRVLFSGIEKFEIIAANQNNWKLIYNPKKILPITNANTPYPLEEIEFYDLSADPGEQNNIVGQNYEMAKDLIEKIERFREEQVLGKKREAKQGQIKIDEKQKKEALEALKALGYIK